MNQTAIMPLTSLSQEMVVADEETPRSNILCNSCQQFSEKSFFFNKPQASKRRSLGQRWGYLGFRKFRDIQQQVQCPLCRLVCSSLALSSAKRMPSDDDSIYYYRILFGTYQGEHSPTTFTTENDEIDDEKEVQEDTDIWNLYQINRLHVSTDPAVLDNVGSEFCRFLDWGELLGPRAADADISLVQNDATNLEDRFLQGRQVADQLDFDLCKSWLNICTESHGESCTPRPLHEFPRRLSRVIDVEKRMVISAPPTCSYATLSYRWGDISEQLKLEKTTLERLTFPGGLGDEWEDIPHTISDAIAVCSRLSVQYLWVDALCIQQDESGDKLDQMDMMDAIYSGSAFTIVAATGPDSWAGLPGVKNTRRISQNKEAVGSLTLSTAQPTLRTVILDSSWNGRAWTFQEAILPKRLLILTERGAFFQCNAALWCEDTWQEISTHDTDDFNRIRTPRHQNPFWKRSLPSSPDFQSYAELVQDYTRRSMTKYTDSLNAFSGLGRALEKPFGTTFFQGLPLAFFDLALCFETPYLEDVKRLSGFPSWSWCGWQVTDGVSYEEFEGKVLVLCNTFYRIHNHLQTGITIVPFRAESMHCGENLAMKSFKIPTKPPPISTAILYQMNDIERGNLLIFQTLATRLFVSAEDDGNGEYMIRTRARKSLGGKPIDCVGRVRVHPSWRKRYTHKMRFHFIEICTQYRTDHGCKLLVMLVERDGRGISRRVQMCDVDEQRWMETKLVEETVYLL